MKVWNETRGFGEIIDKTETHIIVKWDCDPWVNETFPIDSDFIKGVK